MRIYSYLDYLPKLGAARAEATGRAWFMVQDPEGRTRLTDDPHRAPRERITGVFQPSPGNDAA